MTNARRRIDWIVVITCLVFASGCSGGGCGGCATFEPIPGGFPVAKRTPNAVQVRVSQTGLASITADPAKVIGPLVGNAMNGVIEFPVPPSCGSTAICCPGGNPQTTPCGPIEIDLVKHPNDTPRLVLAPAQGASRLDVTVRARIKTKMDLPVTALGISCNVNLDTTRGSTPDVIINTQVLFSQDATVGTTRVGAQSTTVTLENADIQLNGNFGCTIAGAFIGLARGQLESQVATQIEGQINTATCKACPSGQVSECGSSFATACTNKVCQVGNRCLEELGLDGRARGTRLFSSLSPGTTGALDVYEVAGGYATTNNNGIALGLLGGMQPGGTVRDRCGPPATEPAPVTIPQSAFFQGNTRPDTNGTFDVALGMHKSQLSEFAYAGYQGGLLCLTIGHSFAAQLSTDTISLLSRSLGDLVQGNSPMAVGLRPQSPPEITLGKNTFMDDGMGGKKLVEPLLDLKFKAMELDFFAAIDDQYVRVFTVVADVHLPIGLQVTGMGQLQPVFGDVADAFTNLSVKNSQAVTESPAQLAALFPTLLNLVLPQLSGGLAPVSLPALGGLKLAVTDVTSVDNNEFLAIFANLVTTMPFMPVDTTAEIAGIVEPSDRVARDPSQWLTHQPPAVTLALGGDTTGLEWSIRIDQGTWSIWSTNPKPTLSPSKFWLPGDHTIEVRARKIGAPETLDDSPAVITVPLGTSVELASDGKTRRRPDLGTSNFHGQPAGAGCACNSAGGASDAAPFALVLLLLVLPLARVRRAAKRLGTIVWLTALAALPGCSCGSDAQCGSAACITGDLPHGSLGRFTSIAGDDNRVVVATYDQGLGDLVAVDVTDPANFVMTVVDGIPANTTPTHDPASYRGGIEEAGPDVGVWTSIALAGGKAQIAYQDRDAFALKFAHETAKGKWESYQVDAPAAGESSVGEYASMVIDASGHPVIAYLALGVDDGMGHRNTELRLARASAADPSESQWTSTTIASAPGSCAGLCGAGTACVAGAAKTDPQTCAPITANCTSACAAGMECVNAACVKPLLDPKIDDIPGGTGVFVSLVLLPDGRLAAAYNDRSKRALVLAVETAVGASTFTETPLDATAPGDRGMWSAAVVDTAGTVHVAYQDAVADEVMYTTWSNGTAGTPQLVDDGQRAGDRTHNVGAAAAIYLVNGSPVIAYQDGLTSDVYVATKSGMTWTTNPLASSPLLDGWSIAATTAHGGTPYLAWGSIDPNAQPLGSLVVQKP